MTLHPEIAQALASMPAPPDGPLDPVAMRAAEEDEVPQDRLPLHAVEDTHAGEVPVRIYTPTAAETHGLLLYFHGGAFFLGSLNTHDHIARCLAEATGVKVISVGYRRAPESAFPAGLSDCYAVLRWAVEQGGELGWDGELLAVAGDSSGGNFAAVVAAMAYDDGFDRVTHQVLLYPSLDLDFDQDRFPSLRENAEGYGLETAALKPFNGLYLDSGADPADPRVSPVKRAELTGLPPALIVTAEHDPMRDEGEHYGQRLRESGVDSRVSRYSGAGHGFVQHFSWIPDYRVVFEEIRDFLRGRR